jgi:16S rRNA (cytosine1402-N4)-methyltransferase
MLSPRAGETYVDCTAGLGGHAAVVGAVVGGGGKVVLNDMDAGNLERAGGRAREAMRTSGGKVEIFQGNYADLPRKMMDADPPLAADMVLADLGFASNQIEEAGRGFSFSREGPLDMRMDRGSPVSAADLVNGMGEGELEEIIREYGEDRNSARIARKLVEARKQAPITTTARLAELVRAAFGGRPQSTPRGPGVIDPATRTFQALRIAVNDELGSLGSLLDSIGRGARALAAGKASWLRPGARVGVISFHSLEDRPVKQAFAELVREGLAEALSRKPVEAGSAETAVNPRARSAKLRGVRLVGG